jgi:hypothetical protein
MKTGAPARACECVTVTKGRAQIVAIQHRIERAATLYRRSYHILNKIQPSHTDFPLLKVLEPRDVSGLTRQADEMLIKRGGVHLETLASDGNYLQSWIWYTYGATHKTPPEPAVSTDAAADAAVTTTSGAEDPDSLALPTSADKVAVAAETQMLDQHRRAAWAKARGRADRWEEEKRLTVEEMRRTLAYLSWRSEWWQQHGSAFTAMSFSLSAVLNSGKGGYAAKQSEVYSTIATEFAIKWAPLLEHLLMDCSWLLPHLPPGFVPPKLKKSKKNLPEKSINKSISRPGCTLTTPTTALTTSGGLPVRNPVDPQPMPLSRSIPVAAARSSFLAGDLSGDVLTDDEDGNNSSSDDWEDEYNAGEELDEFEV